MRDGESKQTPILVVDDNRLVRELIADTLQSAGYEVSQAASGGEALELVGEAPPVLAVIDVVMPEMDGWTLAEALIARTRARTLPIVFLSAERGLPPAARQFVRGTFEILPKPFTSEDLLARVGLLLPAPELAPDSEKSPLSGNTSHVPVADLVQLLALNRRTGCLHLEGERTGRIHVRQGQVVGAFTGRVHGLKALYRMFGWEKAEFRFETRDSEVFTGPLGPSPERLLMDGLVAHDEMKALRPRLPGGNERLGLAEGVRAFLSRPAELSPAEAWVLREARQRPTLDQLLDQVERPDLEVARAVIHLIEREALAVIPGKEFSI